MQKFRLIPVIQTLSTYFGLVPEETRGFRPYTVFGDDPDFKNSYSIFDIYLKPTEDYSDLIFKYKPECEHYSREVFSEETACFHSPLNFLLEFTKTHEEQVNVQDSIGTTTDFEQLSGEKSREIILEKLK